MDRGAISNGLSEPTNHVAWTGADTPMPCPHTKKQSYRVRGDALIAMLEIKARSGWLPPRAGPYVCSQCGWWHWTSRGYTSNRTANQQPASGAEREGE